MTMNPGTELDAIIAGRLMGWRVYGTKINRNGYIAYLADFKPSTEWKDMQLVVEEMQRRGWDFVIESMSYNQGKHHARFYQREEGYYGECDSEESFPHAVCMAALSALEGQADEK